jgi:flavin-dependent dehydrogenase
MNVIVIGGGPAGAVFAARLLSQANATASAHTVTVLEKATFPRFHLGESLLPQTLHALDAIGVLPALHERFLVKRGAQFFDDLGSISGERRSVRFSFDGAFDARFTYSFQVPRDELDLLLLERAATLGADVRQGWTVTAPVRSEGDGGAVIGVDALDPDGKTHRLLADLVVDASGRDALVARSERATRSIEGLDGTSLYAHFEGVPRDEGEASGDVRIVLFDGGWIWLIPFKDGRTSVGVVLPREAMRARRQQGALDVDAVFRDVLATTPTTAALLASAKQLWPAEATADFSYRCERMHGPGWLAIGDAGGFIDPLFSTGVHLAVQGAFLAADVVGKGAPSATDFAAWEAQVRTGAELFLTAVQAFYAGKLLPYMFASNPRTFLRRAITSMLAGDVFDGEARWARDMKSRLAALPALARPLPAPPPPGA